MDPYISPEDLDLNNYYYPLKMQNLKKANEAHSQCLEVLEVLPVKLIAQTTTACNLSCPFCQISKKNKCIHMSKETFDIVVEELFPTLIEMHPSNIGEALLWPRFKEMCETMNEYGVLLDLTTNGTLLDSKKIELIAPIARDIKISFDGAKKYTYEKLKLGANFDKVCKNLRSFIEYTNGIETRKPIISMQMTLMRSNYKELPDLIKLGHSLGVDRIKAYHLFSFTKEMDNESLMVEFNNYEDVLVKSLKLGKQLGIKLELAEPRCNDNKDIDLISTKCHLPWHESWIDIDGSVFPCHSHGGSIFGNIHKNSFMEIWNTKHYREIRKDFGNNKPKWNCAGCGMTYQKHEEHQRVPYDIENFLSPEYRSNVPNEKQSPIRWSGRMKQFDIARRLCKDDK